jgi:hypothetical protein
VALGLAFLAPTRNPGADFTTPDGVIAGVRAALQQGDLIRPEPARVIGSSTDDEGSVHYPRRRTAVRIPGARLTTNAPTVDGDTARGICAPIRTRCGLFGLGDSSYSNQNTVRLARESGQWRITAPPDPFLLERLP